MQPSGPLNRVLKRVDDLPTLPTVLQEIMQITSQEDTSAQDLIEVVQTDQSLTANLLRVANSPVYGVPYRIQSAKQAIVLLGFNEVRNIAVSATVFSTLAQSATGSVFDREGFWRHSFLVAHLTRELYEAFPDPERKALYYTAGLLHDVGIVVLDHFFPIEFKDILDTVKQEEENPLRAERRFMGVDHAAIGAYVLKRWQLPAELVAAVEQHHTPWELEEKSPLGQALFFANLLAHALGYRAYADAGEVQLDQWLKSPEADKLREAGLMADEKILADRLAKYQEDEVLLDLIMGAAAPL